MANKKAKRRPREKQARFPKAPVNHNGSKPISGNFQPEFKKGNQV